MQKDQILEILVDWNYWGNYRDKSISRGGYITKLEHLLKIKEIVVIKGVRRSGKSTLILQFLRKLIENGVKEKNILIVNFEDPRFKTLDLKLLNEIYEVYLEELQPSGGQWIILDEVQAVGGWEKFARYLHEAKKARVFITGSSSKLLSEEYSTLLSGRHVDMEVFPLSFSEFLEFNQVPIKNKVEATKFRHQIKNLLKEYMLYGSFPKVSLLKEGKDELLTSYFRDILIKDVQQRFSIRKGKKLEELAKYYLTNTSSLQSFNRTRKVMNLSLDTLERFSQYFSIARLIFFLPRFSFSLKKQILNPKKVYCGDTGLRNVVSFKFTEDLGKIAENIVFLNLFRMNEDLYYWKDSTGKEVDFVVREKSRIKELIQVCWSVEHQKTKEREVTSLLRAMDEFKLKKGLIITGDFASEEEVNHKKIIYKPLWKWLLGF